MNDHSPLRVVMADDHPVVRAGLHALIDAQPNMTVVASFATAEEVLDSDLIADVILLDLRFGDGQLGGAADTAEIVKRGGPPVLILTTYDTDSDIVTAMEAGAIGYLLKDSATAELTAAIVDAAARKPALAPRVQQQLVRRALAGAVALSPRELEVLRRVAEGLSNEEVAQQLFVSRATVKTHLAHIFDKLQVDSRTAAVAAARKERLID